MLCACVCVVNKVCIAVNESVHPDKRSGRLEDKGGTLGLLVTTELEAVRGRGDVSVHCA